jgi:hypothetical protein
MTNGYALGQLGSAFLTATTHEDPVVRMHADRRASHWVHVLEGLSSGALRLGSRTPVAGLPAWVTLKVLRGGFATGRALAGGALEPDEAALSQRIGVAPMRRLLFGHYLTDDGLRELDLLLDTGNYRVEVPEDAALLVVAWLVRSGDRAAALELLDTLAPFGPRLRFAPKAASAPTTPPDHVCRMTAGETRSILATRKKQRQVETQREALVVWNPFADRVLALCCEIVHDGRVDPEISPGWRARAVSLLDEYDRLARVHLLCTKHRRPGENLAILLRSMRELLQTETLRPRQRGLLQCAVAGMTARRGRPGSEPLLALRTQQQAVARLPAHNRLAAIAADRLRSVDASEGLARPGDFGGPVTPGESEASAVPAGTAMPDIVPRVLRRAHAAPIETLLDEGVVPSSEVLAALVPGISATVVASTYSDPALARLMAANYRAFRRRRSLLLLNLEKQVQISELPWVRAVAGHSSERATGEALAVAQRMGALAVDHFPATIMPNPLVQELDQLLRTAGHDLPLVEELAADIFMGRFSDKFRRAAQMADRILRGTLYADYFGIDYQQVAGLCPDEPRRPIWSRRRAPSPAATFSTMCRERAGFTVDRARSVAANGAVIEQSQILTTHNLAALVAMGVQPTQTWAELADEAYSQVVSLLDLAKGQARPLPTIKDAAYAWRQTLFFLSLAPRSEVCAFLDRSHARQVVTAPPISLILGGLEHVLAGGTFAADGTCPRGRRLLGWTTHRHWALGAGVDG